MKRLWLASSSPRRSELLKSAGSSFEIVRPDIDETPLPSEAANLYVARLSREKAHAVYQQKSHTASDALILSADTTVADGDQILGKPATPAEAVAMLQKLRGRAHFVYTGVSVLDSTNGETSTEVVTTRVCMRAYTDDEIAAYVDSGDPMGKAGSYAIQNKAFHPAESIEGCYTNVVGLPLCAVCQLLGSHGVAMIDTIRCSSHTLPCAFDK